MHRIKETADGAAGPGTGNGMVNPVQAVTAVLPEDGAGAAPPGPAHVPVSRAAAPDTRARAAALAVAAAALGVAAAVIAAAALIQASRRRPLPPATPQQRDTPKSGRPSRSSGTAKRSHGRRRMNVTSRSA